MSYIWLNGYRTELNSRLTSKAAILPINDAKALANRLNEGHSYLLLNDGSNTEIVKVTTFGEQVKIERGQEETEAKAFPAGTCVKWEITKTGIQEAIEGVDVSLCEKCRCCD